MAFFLHLFFGYCLSIDILCTKKSIFGEYMQYWIFYPPLKHATGGTVVLLQLASRLMELGRLQGVLYWDTPLESHENIFPWVHVQSAKLRAQDCLIIPEGWPNALAFGFKAGCRSLVYCQNWAYLFQGLEPGVRWHNLPVDFLAVSDPVAWHMEQILGKRPPIIRPTINQKIFFPPDNKPSGNYRVGFMPRKNKALAEQIQRIFAERNPHISLDWIPIHGLDPEGVAQVLRSCHIFLVTGFPEGCPLPPLEAMACGCLCVGFNGFGGWDYMRQIDELGFIPPQYPLRTVPWQGNGWWVADGDVLGAAQGLELAIKKLTSHDCHAIQQNIP